MKIFSVLICLLITFNLSDSGKKPIPEKIAEGLDFPEGPAWDGVGRLYVSNCYADWIALIAEGGMDTFALKPTTPYNFGKTNGLTFSTDGNLYACDYEKGAIIRFSMKGDCEAVIDGYLGKRFNRPNDLAFDPKGNLYFTDPHLYDAEKRDGVVYAFSIGTNRVRPVYEGLGFPNGIAFSADGRSLFVCESALNRVLKFAVDSEGDLGSYTIFAEMPGGDPDGLAIDQAGNVYVAHFGGGQVYKFNPDGTVADTIRVPGKKPTNVEFGGKDLKTLYITEVETNSIYQIQVNIPGLKLFGLP